MTLGALAAACARRWYVVVLALAAGAYGSFAIWNSAQGTYSYTGQIAVVQNPELQALLRSDDPSSVRNPWVSDPTALTALLAARMAATAPTEVDWTIATKIDNLRSVTYFDVTLVTDALVPQDEANSAILDVADEAINDLQDGVGVPVEQRFVATLSAAPTETVATYAGRLQSAVGLMAGAGLVGLTLAAALDALVRRSRPQNATGRRRAAPAGPATYASAGAHDG